MFNKVILIGRLTKQPELRATQTGKFVSNFTVAVNRPYVDQYGNRNADFINIVTWGKLAENCAQHLDKGKLVAVEGRLEIKKDTDKNGENRYFTSVVAESVRFLSPKDKSGEQDPLPPDDDIPF